MEKRALPEARSFLKARENKTYGYMGKKAHHKLVTRGTSLSLSRNCLTFLFLTSPPLLMTPASRSLSSCYVPSHRLLPDGLLFPSSLPIFLKNPVGCFGLSCKKNKTGE